MIARTDRVGLVSGHWRRWKTVAAMEVANRLHQTIDGLSVYIGVMPAELLKEHPESHPEITMHGGVRTASNEYHLVVAVFDAGSGARITDATVIATVFGPGNTVIYGQRHSRLLPAVPQKTLEPMTIGQMLTYGGFFVLPKPATYTFQLTITRPGRTKPTVTSLVYDHRG